MDSNVDFQNLCQMIHRNINKVMIGKDTVIDLLLVALAAGGHVLIEDVPGVGKTTLVSMVANSLNLSFKRIQFTPDLMPSDIVGFNLYNQKTGLFEFQKGAVMSQIVLADEINRTSPKTQSALLEVMQEGQVTVDGTTYKLPAPFMVLATQNPVEQLGTYPLPEAQLDRFMLKVNIGYPSIKEEMQILKLHMQPEIETQVSPVASVHNVLWMQNQVKKVHCAPAIRQYIAMISANTRKHPDVLLGASPRASLMLLQASQALALMQGRGHVRPEDVQYLAEFVLAHRLSLRPESKIRQIKAEDIVQDVLHNTPIPERNQ